MFISETLLVNAIVRPTADKNSMASMLVRDGRVVAVGSEDECRRKIIGAHPEIHDMGGATVLPGFVDPHCHPLMYGQFSRWVDCSWENTPRIEDVITELARSGRKSRGPVRGRGYHHGNVAERRQLNRHDLDRVASDREVLVFHSSGHGAIVNTWTLEKAGIDKYTPDPPGGRFGREEDGSPNGEVWDAAADILTGAAGVKTTNNGPNFHVPDSPEDLIQNLAAAQSDFHAQGVTSIGDAQATSREIQTYLALQKRGDLTLRSELFVLSNHLEELEGLGLGGRLGNDTLAIAGVKIYVDGALTAGMARFSEPYCKHSHTEGYLYHDAEEFAEILLRADTLGLQTATHAQGDAAIEIALEGHRLIRKQNAIPARRHRIEHFGGPTKEQIDRTSELGLWPITQPQYLHRYGEELKRVLGSRAEKLTPLGAMREAGVPLVLSSDAPVCPPLPLEAVYSAVSRQTTGGTHLGQISERVGVEDALHAHTLNAAASLHRETSVGSLEQGKLADWIVLSRDPLNVPLSEIARIKIMQTWVGGKLVYERDGLDSR